MQPQEFARRRRRLMDLIGAGGLAVLPAAPERSRTRDTLYNYRPDSDLYYVTGFEEPEAVAVLIPGRSQGEFIFFCQEKDPERELWYGLRAGPRGAVAEYGADDAFPISDIDEILPGLLEQSERVYYTMGVSIDFDQRLLGWMNVLASRRQNGQTPDELVALDHLLHEMRLFKDRREVSAMRSSARIAVGAHSRTMRACRPGMMEYELEAELLYEFHRNGAENSYWPIVASGENACVLHYQKNDARLQDGDLVLVDAGCEYQFYASDITRTYPINGEFTKPQRELYDVVYAANRAAITKVQPGNHWNDPHNAAVKEITLGLRDIGILSGRLPGLIKTGAYRPFFMHRTGHWLGMDVHDVGNYKVDERWRLLEPGMVMTVEPGIYISGKARDVPKRWRGIGIRIEDDVYLSRNGPQVLSQALPVLAEEIEDLMAGAK